MSNSNQSVFGKIPVGVNVQTVPAPQPAQPAEQLK